MGKNNKIIILITIFTITFLLVTCFYPKDNKIFSPIPSEKPNNNPVVAITGKGEELKADGTYNIPANFAFVCSENSLNKSVTLTASVKPDSVTNKKIIWSVSWVNESIKSNVTNFVTISVNEDTSQCIVTYVDDFGAQIKVIAKSADNHNITATCTIDCMQKLEKTNTFFYANEDKLKIAYDKCLAVYNAGGLDGEYNKAHPCDGRLYTTLYAHVWNGFPDFEDVCTDLILGFNPDGSSYIINYEFIDSLMILPKYVKQYTLPFDEKYFNDVTISFDIDVNSYAPEVVTKFFNKKTIKYKASPTKELVTIGGRPNYVHIEGYKVLNFNLDNMLKALLNNDSLYNELYKNQQGMDIYVSIQFNDKDISENQIKLEIPFEYFKKY